MIIVSGFVWPDGLSPQQDDYGAMPSWDDENAFDGSFDNESAYGDNEDLSNLVSQPRQVFFMNNFNL